MVAQQVDELAHQERRHWAQRARLHQRLHNDATHGLSARSERRHDDDTVLDAGGGGSPAVDDRTSRTFLSKRLCG